MRQVTYSRVSSQTEDRRNAENNKENVSVLSFFQPDRKGEVDSPSSRNKFILPVFKGCGCISQATGSKALILHVKVLLTEKKLGNDDYRKWPKNQKAENEGGRCQCPQAECDHCTENDVFDV